MNSALGLERAGLRRSGLLAALLLAWCSSAFALNPTLDISQYAHTSWKIRDGFAKGAITAIAQTPDGYLWLGTEFGLLRFDGVRTVTWRPPSGEVLPSDWITSLLVTRDGTMWIGTFKGLISWKGGVIARYPRLAGIGISTLIEDRRGTVWAAGSAANSGRLCAVDTSAGAANCYGADGTLGGFVGSAFEDSAGVLWVGAQNGLWRWAPGPPTRYTDLADSKMADAFLEVNHALIVATRPGLRRFVDGRLEEYPVAGGHGVKSGVLLRDRNGGLWIGTNGAGLTHVHEGQTDVFGQADGLSSDFVQGLFEDREGNIWVATNNGLDRFREFAVSTIAVKQGLSSESVNSVLPAADGGMWFGMSDGLDRWRDGRIDHDLRRPIRFLIQDLRRRLWAATDREVGFVERGRFEAISGVPGGQIRDMDVDRDGDIWMAHQDLGLFRVHERGSESIPWSVLGRPDFASAIAADHEHGGVWLGFYTGGLAYFADGRIRTSYAASDGVAGGAVNDLHFDPGGSLWAATEGGLTRVKDRRIATLSSGNGLRCDGVHWMREDDAGAAWLNTTCGLVRVSRADLDAWAAASEAGRRSERIVNVTIFDASDGVRSHYPVGGGYGPKIAKSADGRLWFLPADGVSIVDPQRMPVNRIPAPVHIEQITADRKSYELTPEAGRPFRLPPLIRDVRIDYTALSLVAPEKMRFRYKLEGYDRDWQDAATRRQAFYTNLPPRAYRFRVTASNNSGVWNDAGAALDFSIAPTYYQTAWFPALVMGALLTLIWAAHRLRLRIVRRHEREITALNERMMKAQEQERMRIAGELHDGVMQQMLSVTMMLGTAKRRVATSPADATATIEKVQEKLIQAGTDIRQLSHGLHPPMLQEAGLPAAVRAYCEEFAAASGVQISCECDESARDLSRGAGLALFRVLQEALGNAAKHAQATRIIVRLSRANGMVSLVVSDDGRGFDPGELGASGGLGLVMMRERATQLNGTFTVDSAPGRGTRISVAVPFR
jgi:signal transduction histidine kinase/ligand-binding sensor domain-containing protein